eukprot:CFRG4718T1
MIRSGFLPGQLRFMPWLKWLFAPEVDSADIDEKTDSIDGTVSSLYNHENQSRFADESMLVVESESGALSFDKSREDSQKHRRPVVEDTSDVLLHHSNMEEMGIDSSSSSVEEGSTPNYDLSTPESFCQPLSGLNNCVDLNLASVSLDNFTKTIATTTCFSPSSSDTDDEDEDDFDLSDEFGGEFGLWLGREKGSGYDEEMGEAPVYSCGHGVVEYAVDADERMEDVETEKYKNRRIRFARILDFFEGVKCGDLDAVRGYLERDGVLVRDIDMTDAKGFSALHTAAQLGYLNVVVYLLDHGANVNATNFENCTPLHYAIIEEDYDLAKLLVDHKAAVDIIDYDGKTPMDLMVNPPAELFEAMQSRAMLSELHNERTTIHKHLGSEGDSEFSTTDDSEDEGESVNADADICEDVCEDVKNKESVNLADAQDLGDGSESACLEVESDTSSTDAVVEVNSVLDVTEYGEASSDCTLAESESESIPNPVNHNAPNTTTVSNVEGCEGTCETADDVSDTKTTDSRQESASEAVNEHIKTVFHGAKDTETLNSGRNDDEEDEPTQQIAPGVVGNSPKVSTTVCNNKNNIEGLGNVLDVRVGSAGGDVSALAVKVGDAS